MSKSGQTVPPAHRLLARLTGARLCFGRPVEVEGRTVIPVASVRTAGGYGFGGEPRGRQTSGGGGGGALDARPIGFIEISSTGTRFERIDDGRMALRAMATALLAVFVVGRRFVRRRRRALNGVPPRLRLRRGGQASQPS